MLLALLQGLIDLLTGSVWTYPLLFGISAGDAVFPAFPSETALIVCGLQAARGELSLEWVIVSAGLGAFIGDNASYAAGRYSSICRRYRSTMRAHCRPSLIAHTISDWPRRASPAANTPSAEVA